MSDNPMQIRSDINSVLHQMRAMRAAAGAELNRDMGVKDLADPGGAPAVRNDQFATLLKSAVDNVNNLQQASSAAATAFSRGETNNLVDVMIAGQKATVGFQALTQVRNRVVSAYQDIMNMPI